MYKEMAYKDAEKRAKQEAYNKLSARERANAEAANFDAKMWAPCPIPTWSWLALSPPFALPDRGP